jgi:hypothetical protein
MTTSGMPGSHPGRHQDESLTGSEGEPVPRDTAVAWRASEAQLYGTLLADPAMFERAVLLVARVVEHLRRLGSSSAALVAAGGSAGSLVLEVADRDGVDSSLDPTLIGQAALAMRLREVVGEQARTRRLSLLAAAAERGVPWVVLEESGEQHGDPFDPYQRLEVEVSTGRAVYVTTVPDESFTGVLHEVALLTVDLGDGRVREAEVDAGLPGPPPSRHEDWVARERRVDQLRGGPPPR